MHVVVRSSFRVLLVIAAFATLGSIAAAASDIAYGVVYDCGPTRAKIKVFNCGATMCNVLYVNDYSPGGGARMSMSRVTLEKTLRGEYGGGPCRAPGVPVLAPRTNANTGTTNTGAANTRTTGTYANGQTHYGTAATTQAPAGGGDVTAAHYVCFYFTRPEGVNFTILGGGRYRDDSGAGGAYSLDRAASVITFRGAALNGRRAAYRPGRGAANPPTIAFLSRGAEIDGCQPGQ